VVRVHLDDRVADRAAGSRARIAPKDEPYSTSRPHRGGTRRDADLVRLDVPGASVAMQTGVSDGRWKPPP
jgi:hypothetical protein